jgi:hypothetical protein
MKTIKQLKEEIEALKAQVNFEIGKRQGLIEYLEEIEKDEKENNRKAVRGSSKDIQ